MAFADGGGEGPLEGDGVAGDGGDGGVGDDGFAVLERRGDVDGFPFDGGGGGGEDVFY